MKLKPIEERAAAKRDAELAVDYYLEEAGPDAALGFLDALEWAYDQIAGAPGAGSPRSGQVMGVPGLCSWRLDRYPYLVFYLEHDSFVEVRRVLHGRRDLPAAFREP